MTKEAMESILNKWQVYSSSERWSLRSMFTRVSGESTTEDDFIRFLEEKLGKERNPERN